MAHVWCWNYLCVGPTRCLDRLNKWIFFTSTFSLLWIAGCKSCGSLGISLFFFFFSSTSRQWRSFIDWVWLTIVAVFVEFQFFFFPPIFLRRFDLTTLPVDVFLTRFSFETKNSEPFVNSRACSFTSCCAGHMYIKKNTKCMLVSASSRLKLKARSSALMSSEIWNTWSRN